MLADEGALVLQFCLHSQRSSSESAGKARKQAPTRGVSPRRMAGAQNYDSVRERLGRAIRSQDGHAPCTVGRRPDSEFRTSRRQARWRRSSSGSRPAGVVSVTAAAAVPPVDGLRLLDALDLGRSSRPAEYKDRLAALQGLLRHAHAQEALQRRRRCGVEGPAAAMAAPSPRCARPSCTLYRIVGGRGARRTRSAPHPYLWRFCAIAAPRPHGPSIVLDGGFWSRGRRLRSARGPGCAPMARSTISRGHGRPVRALPSSCSHQHKSSCAASRAPRQPFSATRSAPRLAQRKKWNLSPPPQPCSSAPRRPSTVDSGPRRGQRYAVSWSRTLCEVSRTLD